MTTPSHSNAPLIPTRPSISPLIFDRFVPGSPNWIHICNNLASLFPSVWETNRLVDDVYKQGNTFSETLFRHFPFSTYFFIVKPMLFFVVRRLDKST